MRLLCRLGLHKWGMYEAAEYRCPLDERLAIPSKPAQRQCLCCPTAQVRDEHCLGLNPPEYVHTWYRMV